MSSNIEINKLCVFCGETFIAKTTVTKYCSLKCNSRHYKVKIKDLKIQNSIYKDQAIKPFLNHLQPASLPHRSKDYLSIQETSELIGVSRWTINRMIKRGELITHKFGRKKIIERSQIDNLFR